MLHIVHSRLHRFLIATVFAFCTASSQASSISLAVQLQIYASRATCSLLLLRGEGFQSAHLARLNQDIRDIEYTSQQVADTDPQLLALTKRLIEQLLAGVSYGPNEEEMPWGYPRNLSRALRELLVHANRQPTFSPNALLPAKVEYLTVQYLARAYIGNFEIAREQSDNYLGQDERILVPDIDRQLADSASDSSLSVSKLKARWAYLRVALLDMNSQDSAITSNSGRAFAPIMVDHHAQSLTTQWISLYQTKDF